MDDVTDVVFRSIVVDCAAPDMFFTEFVNVDGLCSVGRPKLLHKLIIDKKTDHKIIAQIWGKVPQNYKKIAAELLEMGFDGIDINMGCPQKNEVKNGCCSALINDRELASKIIEATQEGAENLPVSVKTRLGWNEIDLSWHEFLLGHGLDMLTVHMRTRAEMSDVPAHWDVMPEIINLRDKISPKTKIIMNGDITNKQHGESLVRQYGADGIMIGRGVFKDLYCFSSDTNIWSNMSPEQRIKLYKTHIERFMDRYKNRERNFQTLRRFCKVYINGIPGANELRESLMQCENSSEMITRLDDYLL